MRVFLVVLIVFCISCKGETLPKTEKLKLIVLDFDSIKRIEKYVLHRETKDSITVYDYRHENQEIKNIRMTYNYKSDLLVWSNEMGKVKNEKYFNERISKEEFHLYSEMGAISHKNRIFFHKKYGILAISNLNNPCLIFAKDEMTRNFSKEIFEEILE